MSSRVFFTTDRSRRRPAYVVTALAVVNVLVYIASALAGPDAPYVYGLVPGNPSLTGFLASLFIHGSGYHLVLNLAVLWLFARDVEDVLGHAEVLVLYVTSGLAANLLQAAAMLVLDPLAVTMPQVGASGAISGMLGLFAVRWYFLNLIIGVGKRPEEEGVYRIPAWWVVLVLVALQMLGAALSLWGRRDMVAYWGHLGGFVFGAAVGEALRLGRLARFDFLTLQARKAAASGDHIAAVRFRRQLLDMAIERPLDPQALVETAEAHEWMGDHAVAKECYLRALTMALESGDPDRVRETWLRMRGIPAAFRRLPRERLERLAFILEQQREFADAAALHGLIATLSPGSPEAGALYHQARILASRLHCPSAAARILSRLQAEHPDSQWTHAAEEVLGAVQNSPPPRPA